MRVSIINIAYNLPESNRRLFETAMLDADKHDIEFQLFLHSKDEETAATCAELSREFPCIYYPYGINRGLSLSWNDGILYAASKGFDVTIIANDDVNFANGDIDKIARKSIECRDNYMVSVRGFNQAHGKVIPSNGYSCFALNPIALERIGMFDQNIFPVYGEDQDHHRRAHILGLVEANCNDTNIYHVGSNSIKNSPLLARQNVVTQSKNGRYLIMKWGTDGLTGGFPRPFNDKRFDCYIDPKVRHAPYPGYNREDQGIVRF